MPLFSIVVPVYNTAPYLPACLDSLISQDCTDWEALVVIDASPDAASQIAQSYARKDSRIIPIVKPVNGGLHLARKTGVAASHGKHVLFLDSDDTFSPALLEQLSAIQRDHPEADIVHFGMDAVAADEGMREIVSGMLPGANRDYPPLTGPNITDTVFAQSQGFQRDWRVTQRSFDGTLARDGFDSMVATRLERAEDAYEYFVLSSRANCELTRNDIIGYRYNMGLGTNNSRSVSLDYFASMLRQYRDCYKAVTAFALATSDPHLIEDAKGFTFKMLETMGTDWYTKVPDDIKKPAINIFADIVGAEAAATQVMRCTRDRAYELWINGCTPEQIALVREWYNGARECVAGLDNLGSDYRHFELFCKRHLNDVTQRAANDGVAKNESSTVAAIEHQEAPQPAPSVKPRWRRLVNLLAPPGSVRRTSLQSVVRFIRNR